MKKHIATYKCYYLSYFVFVICLFSSPKIYSHFHFDVINPVELYQAAKESHDLKYGGELPYMSYYEWQIDQDRRHEDFLTEFGYQCAESFDPWFERPNSIEKTEHGRD